ncbi:MAG: membrane protein insertase YidC [Oscillospiraceae bacterium]
MEIINTIVGIPLGYLMWFCFYLIKNYGVAIILFTLLTKVIMFPLSIWVQKNSIKMVRIQPEINMLSAKYAGDKNKISEDQLALFKREKYNPLAGIIPMLIQIPIIIGLIAVVYNPLQHLLHIDMQVIDAFVSKASEIIPNLDSSTAQLTVIDLIKNSNHIGEFAAISIPNENVALAISQIQNMNLSFLGLDLAHMPSIKSFDVYLLIPILSGLSAFLLCLFQNKENVLQKEQGILGRWGMTIFLVAFSTYFAFIVPSGIGLYWIFGNIFAIALIYILNAMYNPKKFIDYEALEESKRQLAISKKIEKEQQCTPEQKLKGKADYKKFCKEDPTGKHKQVVIYSEKSGFYKYFENMINKILQSSDIIIHYVTSDPNDAIFKTCNDRIISYYIDDVHLIPLFMKIESDVCVMTTPNLQTYHLKRSYIRKDVEYIYIPHDPSSVHMAFAKDAMDNFDTVFCVGQTQINEIRKAEQLYKLKPKNLVACGYGLIDNLIESYKKIGGVTNDVKKILIAPSWQDGNILDSCLDDMLECLIDAGYDITLRPHPEYVKRFSINMQEIIEKYSPRFSDTFRIETDFSSNVTIFTADLVITDWSGISVEFSYSTKKPTLFINTKIKIINKDYEELGMVPLDISLRDKIGKSIDLSNVTNIKEVIDELFQKQDEYKNTISDIVQSNVFNLGHSGEVAGQYVIDAVNKMNSNQSNSL